MKSSEENKTNSSPESKQEDFIIIEKNDSIPVAPAMDQNDIVIILRYNRDLAKRITELERDDYKVKLIPGSNLYNAEYDPDYYFWG